MNDYSQSFYRPNEYFSVARGEKFADGNLILINKGAIKHFAGKAEKVKHGITGPKYFAQPREEHLDTIILNRVDEYQNNSQVEIPAEEYNQSLVVKDGSKLYLKYSSPLKNSTLNLPIVLYTSLYAYEFPGAKIKINQQSFNNFSANYSVETDYLSSFETNDFEVSFNFLIAEFEKRGTLLIKKQIHSGIIFMPRVFRLNENVT